MKTPLAILLLLITSFAANAGFISGQKVIQPFGATNIKFGISHPSGASGVCEYYGRHFIFNATTPAGQNMYSMLLSAYMANKSVDVWYTASTTPDTSAANGCTTQTMAVVTQLGLRD